MLPFRDYNPSRTFPLVTITLIVLNSLICFYMWVPLGQDSEMSIQLIHKFAMVPKEVLSGVADHYTLHPVWLTVITAMFLHGSIMHLAGNMLYLWIFGNNIEDIMGHGRFLVFYLFCGILAAAAHISRDTQSLMPTLGASGAISGVLGAYLVKFPRAQIDSCLFILFYFTVVRLPAIIVLGFWFLLQLFNAYQLSPHNHTGGVAFWEHVGGFLAGMIFVNIFAKSQQTKYNDRWER